MGRPAPRGAPPRPAPRAGGRHPRQRRVGRPRAHGSAARHRWPLGCPRRDVRARRGGGGRRAARGVRPGGGTGVGVVFAADGRGGGGHRGWLHRRARPRCAVAAQVGGVVAAVSGRASLVMAAVVAALSDTYVHSIRFVGQVLAMHVGRGCLLPLRALSLASCARRDVVGRMRIWPCNRLFQTHPGNGQWLR